MKVGDIIINPWVPEYHNGKPNPMYKSMITHVGSEYTTTLRYDGKRSKYYTKDIKQWEILGHIDIKSMILKEYKEEEKSYDEEECQFNCRISAISDSSCSYECKMKCPHGVKDKKG